jgi:uncharacterized protein YjbJ (UPF0337 family)
LSILGIKKMEFKKHTEINPFSRSTPSIKEKWEVQKAKFKKKYPSLTDSDLRYDEGKKGDMYEKIRTKLGISADELKKFLADL